ncbi:Nucleoporin [Caenorhabditis elegans]|uniref:Nucleoporin n=1 Tax=Caenorhabditis elegans TaxID=6239 RepID=Q8IG09_CAEEL|nr:Nucleoporin [Caenorhabditis elegans]CCD72617.1 Nucleoporin [Caenorhabditis elegans]|eukprot:NP_871696.1 Uncharacterized protein CELE_K04C2.3 [Caenorhabditis elegans]
MATQTAVTATTVPQGSPSVTGSASQGGILNSARQFFSLAAPKVEKGDFS